MREGGIKSFLRNFCYIDENVLSTGILELEEYGLSTHSCHLPCYLQEILCAAGDKKMRQRLRGKKK